MYVVNAGSNDASIIESSTNTVIQTIDVGRTPSNCTILLVILLTEICMW